VWTPVCAVEVSREEMCSIDSALDRPSIGPALVTGTEVVHRIRCCDPSKSRGKGTEDMAREQTWREGSREKRKKEREGEGWERVGGRREIALHGLGKE
jgi:hypothetical protein